MIHPETDRTSRFDQLPFQDRQVFLLSGEHNNDELPGIFYNQLISPLIESDPATSALFKSYLESLKEMPYWADKDMAEKIFVFLQMGGLAKSGINNQLLFLIEGSSTSSAMREVNLLRSVAEINKIPLADHILPIDSITVINATLKSNPDFDRENAMGYFVLKRYGEKLPGETLEDVVQKFRTKWELSFKTILDAIDHRLNVMKTEDNPDFVLELGTTSNQFSQKIAEYYIRHYPKRSKVVAYSGAFHREIFEPNTLVLPDLSDQEIENLIQLENAREESFFAVSGNQHAWLGEIKGDDFVKS